jgi:hypothetical protein
VTCPESATCRLVYEPAVAAASPRPQQIVLASSGIVAALAGSPGEAVLDRVWRSVSAQDATLERVVQSIPFRGADAVASFAVAAPEQLENGERSVTLVARGDAVVDVYDAVAGRRRFSAQGLQPWHLASFARVSALRLGTPLPADDPLAGIELRGGEFPLDSGVVSAAWAAWILDEDAIIPIDADDAGDTEVTLERAPTRRRGRHGGPLEMPPDGAPVSADAPPRAVVAASMPRRRPSRVRIGRSAPFELHVPVYVGRRPRGPRQLAADQVILIEVASPGREVSASHVQIEQRGEEVFVTDLRSTNGTTVTLPGAPRIKLPQGESIVLPPYSRIDIGDGNVIEILPGAD